MHRPRHTRPLLLAMGALLCAACAAAPPTVLLPAPTPPGAQPAESPTVAGTTLPTQPATATLAVAPLPPTLEATAVATIPPVEPTATSEPTAIPTLVPTPPAPLTTMASADVGYVPILMYHYIRVVDEAADPLGYRLSVAPDLFVQQMDWIAANGYTPITMANLTDCLRARLECPPRPVVLTFDDGYADNALHALPVLRERGFVGTFFIVSGRVGAPGYMTVEELAALRDAGMEIGAHTVTHADLTQIGLDAATSEIGESRTALEAMLGITVRSFSYPAGKYSDELASVVHSLGFESAVITQSFRGFDQLYTIPRRRVIGGEPIGAFGYNFVPLTR